MNTSHRKKALFVEGPVSPEFVASSIAKHATRQDIGAHQIFLGQIRADVIDGRTVKAIDFSAHTELAEEAYRAYREEFFSRYALTCMHVYHSLGTVRAGEINLFVFVSSAHRQASTQACAELVEWIKRELPVWGKEVFDDDTHRWKVNT